MPRFKKFILLLVIGGVFLSSASFVIFRFSQHFFSKRIVSPVPAVDNQPSLLQILFPRSRSSAALRNIVQKSIGNTWKNYSILVKDLKSDFILQINDTVMYTAASVNKLPILATLYYQVQKGDVDLDKQISLQKEDIQNYGSGSMQNDPPGTTYSVKTLARLMMQVSDNTAAYILANYIVSFDTMQKLLTSWGLTQTDMANNKTSNHDMLLLFEKLFSGGIANPALTNEMLSFLTNTDYEDRLPAALPKTATVYHKTGDAVGSLHDVGVAKEGKTLYYIGIFTSDITDEEETKKLMGKISKQVYDFMR